VAGLTLVALVLGLSAGDTLGNVLNPGRPILILYYRFGRPGAESAAGPSDQTIITLTRALTAWRGALLTLLAGAVETMLLGWWAWWMLKRRGK
jgi:hypothetical protein